MMHLHQDSGLMNICYFKFDVDDSSGELDVSRPVPFRLTPNIVEYLSGIGIAGPFTASAVATSRCLVQPNFKLSTMLRTILKDEIIAVHKKRALDETPAAAMEGQAAFGGDQSSADKGGTVEVDMEKIIEIVNKTVANIMGRLNGLSYIETAENGKMSALVQAAQSAENLCRMDPAWHPWM